jgi:hypothetical protein
MEPSEVLTQRYMMILDILVLLVSKSLEMFKNLLKFQKKYVHHLGNQTSQY